jgi:hypothetical protein
MGHPHPISNPAGPQWSGTRGGPPAIREWIERNRSLTDRGDYRPGVPADPPPGPNGSNTAGCATACSGTAGSAWKPAR